MVGDAVCSGEVEGFRTPARHDAWVDADAARVFGERQVTKTTVLVLDILDSPMTADGAQISAAT
jgi:hypothetical protein